MADISADLAARTRWLAAFAIPDQRLEVWEEESTYTAESPIPSIAEPQGPETLQVQATGTPTGTDTLELRTIRGGYTDGGAGFEYRTEGGDWLRRLHSWELGSGDLVATGTDVVDSISAATLPDGRVVVAYLRHDQAYLIHAAVEQADGTWLATFAGFAPVDTSYVDQGDAAGVDVVTWPDGSIDVYTYSDVLRRYRSTDDGATWGEVSVQLDGVWSTPGIFATGTSRKFAIAQSNGRMLLVETNDSFQYASEDQGYTWDFVGVTPVDVSGERPAIHVIPGGFLLSAGSAFQLVRDPYLASWEAITGGPGGDRTTVAYSDGHYWAVSWTDKVTARVSLQVRRSVDGLDWSTISQDDHHLSTIALHDAVLVASRGGMRLLSVAPSSVELWAHPLGGWSSLGASGPPQNWWVAYTPLSGVLPNTVSDTDEGGATRGTMTVPSVGGAASASGGSLTLSATGFDDGVYFRWTPASGDPDWTVEVDLEVTTATAASGAGVVVLVDTDLFVGQALIDKTGIQMSSGGVDEGPRATVSGRLTIRVQVDQEDDDSGASMQAWYRLHGSSEWVSMGPAIDMDSPGADSIRTELQAVSTATSDVVAEIYGWRIRNEVEPFSGLVAPWSATPQYLQDGISVRSIHGLTHPGDEWHVSVGAEYGPDRLLPSHPSPRQGFRASQNDVATELAYRVPEGEQASAHVVLLEHLRARAVLIYVRIDGEWELYSPTSLSVVRMSIQGTAIGSRHLRLGTAAAATDPLEYIPAGALVGALVISPGGVHEVLASTAGLLGQTLGERVTLTLDSTPTTGSCTLHMPRAAYILHHAPGVEVEGIQIRLSTINEGAGPHNVRAGNAVIAPITWLPEGPDQTATTGIDLMGTISEDEDGHEYATQTRPDRRRVELNFARLLPMYAQDAGDFDHFLAGDGTDAAGTAWTLPQVLTGIARRAGRRPLVYLPAVPYDRDNSTPETAQALTFSAACQVIHGRLAMSSVRHEGVLGHHGTADQVVRDSTWTITEVV